VYGERIDADYGVDEITTEDEAEVCLKRAKEFIAVCGRVFGFTTS
jgi:HEPN domain-containing protein